VLDLDAFERNTKAEGLGVGPDGPAGEKNMHDADFTTWLFRFIQLTSEGHNNDWQNYLRAQVGNPVTVNLVICTVDYLLRLQESMMDFYWYYSRKDCIDPAGLANLLRAIGVASQVLNTIIEVTVTLLYILLISFQFFSILSAELDSKNDITFVCFKGLARTLCWKSTFTC
jgi:hypothetical protein